jgi:hypothetical protein
MAAKTQITNKGLELMASSSKATGQHWWLGWYALAYIPDELQEEDGERLNPSMTKLTTDGDIIYNIFQGDMNGDGYQTTRASDNFKSVNYDSNIKKNYRYVLDDNGRNNLVTWVDGDKGLKGAYVYQGVKVNTYRDDNTIDYTKSTIPLPAPLLYTGVKAAGEGWSSDGMNIFLGSGNDSIKNFYPIDDGVEDTIVPRVSADFRNYEGYKNGLPKIDDGEQDYSNALNTETFDGIDFDGWFPAVNSYTQNGETDMDEGYNQYCRQYWKVLSISNFNKYCAPVNSSGILYNENTGCRNMAKATKYFPISDYSVTSTAKTANNEYATGIKLKVQLKLNGNAEDGAYFKDVEMADADNVSTLNPLPSEEQRVLFNSQKVSFKFNRIGIYAVPMRQYGCSGDNAEMKAQYQIDTEAEPVLFAVCEWDSPVTLSDSGEGLSEFQSDIFIDLSGAVEDSSVIRESAVFYNLYEDDAIDWYKNQLIANASMAEALVNMQIEMGYIRNQKNTKNGCCPKQEVIKQKDNSSTYTGTGLRNLVDALEEKSNSVRNRLAISEGSEIKPDYSDKSPQLVGIGKPTTATYPQAIYARKTSTNVNEYTALLGNPVNGTQYYDAVFDDKTYIGMVPTSMKADSAVRIGSVWVRRNLYYELFSLNAQNSTQLDSVVRDYPPDATTNSYQNIVCDVTDEFGTETEGRGCNGYVTITKNEDGTLSTTDEGITTTGLPEDLNSASDLVDEINRSFENYEIKRVYIAKYTQRAQSRDYSGYKVKRITTLKLPKIQLYSLNTDVFADINQRLTSTGWRIPTNADWEEIIANVTPEDINSIRASSKWEQSGGYGEVYPLSGMVIGSETTDGIYSSPSPVIYLAIADDDLHVVEFNGSSFNVVSKNLPGEVGLGYVSILCVSDAIKVSDGKSKYKIGYDSYALMNGSASIGNHCFNAGDKSIIFESTNYISIFGGLNNKVNNSEYTSILNGCNNTVMNTVFSAILGDDNLVQNGVQNYYDDSVYNTCGIIASSRNSILTACISSILAIENCNVQAVYSSFISGCESDIKSMFYSRFTGQNTQTTIKNLVAFSDVIALEVYHMPQMVYMSRAAVAKDHNDTLPKSLEFDNMVSLNYSELIGEHAYFYRKRDIDSNHISFSRLVVGGSYNTGIINTRISYSDVYAQNDGHLCDVASVNLKEWCSGQTLDSTNITYSNIRLINSSITNAYIDDYPYYTQSFISGSDISMAHSIMNMAIKSGGTISTKSFSYGVWKVTSSILSGSNCSYVYETGTKHYLNNSEIRYATLIGEMIATGASDIAYSTLFGKTISIPSQTNIQNSHIYGSIALPSNTNIDNHIILGGLDGTYLGSAPANSYITDFGNTIASNYKGYPMIWSMGGIGLYLSKMVLGGTVPSVGDVLSVVGVEDNMATVAWRNLPEVPPSGTHIVTYDGGSNTLSEEAYKVITDAVSNNEMVAILYGVGSSSSYYYLSRYDSTGYAFMYNRGTSRTVIHVGNDRSVTRTEYPYVREDVSTISIPGSLTEKTTYDLPAVPANTVALIKLRGNFDTAAYINVQSADGWLSSDSTVGLKNWPLNELMFTVSTSSSAYTPYVNAKTSNDALQLTCSMYLFAK